MPSFPSFNSSSFPSSISPSTTSTPSRKSTISARPRSSKCGNNEYATLPNRTNKCWYRDPGLRKLNVSIGLLFASAAANGFDCSLINGLLAIPEFNNNISAPSFVNSASTVHLTSPTAHTTTAKTYATATSSSILGLLIAAISLGALPSFIPASYVSDFVGRRVSIAVGCVVMLAASISQSLLAGPWSFLATRVAMGVGLAFAQTAAPTLATEIAHPRHRGVVTNSFQAAWYWGSVLSASSTLACLYISTRGGVEVLGISGGWSWRIPCALQGFFPLLQLLGLLFVPESPRFLVAKGRKEQALSMLATYHANGDDEDELVRFEYDEILECIHKERSCDSGFPSFFKTKGNLHRLAIVVLVGVFIQWSGNGVMSYYLAPQLSTLGIHSPAIKASINLALQIWNAILAMFGALAVEKYGRRPLWLTSSIGMFFSLILVLVLSAIYTYSSKPYTGYIAVAGFFLFFAFYDVAFTPLSIAYTIEILPYHLRTKGLSLNLTVTFLASFFNQYVNPVALEKLGWRLYIIYVLLVGGMVVIIYIVFPETKGRTLEEVAYVFDGGSGGGRECMALQEVRYVSATAKKCVTGKESPRCVTPIPV